MDGIIDYIKQYIVRPLKNFVTGSRDFHDINSETNENKEEEEEEDK